MFPAHRHGHGLQRAAAVAGLVAVLVAGGGCFGGVKDPPPLGHAATQNLAGVKRLAVGDTVGAEELFRRALAHAELEDDLVGQAESWTNLGAVWLARGRADEALERYREAHALHAQAGHEEGIARTHVNMGTAELARGRVGPARASFLEALARYERLEDDVAAATGAARARIGLASVLRAENKPAEAVAELERAKQLALEAGDERTLAAALANLGLLHEGAGRLDLAEAALGAALELDKKRVDPVEIGNGLDALARVVEARGDAGRARALLRRAVRVRRQLGDFDQAERDLERLVALCEQAKDPRELESARAELAALRLVREERRKKTPGGEPAPVPQPPGTALPPHGDDDANGPPAPTVRTGAAGAGKGAGDPD